MIVEGGGWEAWRLDMDTWNVGFMRVPGWRGENGIKNLNHLLPSSRNGPGSFLLPEFKGSHGNGQSSAPEVDWALPCLQSS